jgi:hypothetical protein
MNAAKEAVSKLAGQHGHRTEVVEEVRPGVTQETIKPTRHEEITTAKQREVHQDHYHTTVQPLEDRQVLPEKHTHQMAPAQEREFHHGDDSAIRQRLQEETGKFHDTSRVEGTSHSQSQGQTAVGEHTHHHVHETVQPIINREVVQPEVVHTVKPIHEIHHADSQFHGQSVLPTKSLNEFKGETHHNKSVEEYDGVPKTYNKQFQVDQTDADRHPDRKGVDGPQSHHTGGTGLPTDRPFVEDKHYIGSSSGQSGTSTSGTHSGHSHGLQSGSGVKSDTHDSGRQGNTSSLGQGHDSSLTHGTSHGQTQGHQKVGLMDKLNPMKDTDGDGKKGIMD